MSAKEKKGSGGLIFILLLIIIIIIALILFLGGGFGFGSGGNGFGNDAVQVEGSISDTETGTTASVSEINYVDVTVSGSSYLYQNNSYDLAGLIDAVKAIEGDIEIHITLDDTATANAYDDLTAALDENGIPYSSDNTEQSE